MVLVYLSRLFSTTNHYFTLFLNKEAYLNFVHRKPEWDLGTKLSIFWLIWKSSLRADDN